MAMIQVRLPPEATLDDALRLLGLTADDVDTAYGLVAVAPGHYVLRVAEEVAGRVDHPLADVFSDPRIDPQVSDDP